MANILKGKLVQINPFKTRSQGLQRRNCTPDPEKLPLLHPQTKVKGATGIKVMMLLKIDLTDSLIGLSIFCANNSGPYQVNKKITEVCQL